MLKTIADTEMNAMVIDVKEGTGNLYYATDLPQAKAAGAVMSSPLLHLDTLLPMLKSKGIYTIARMVVMKDDTLGSAQPQLAVQNKKTGKPWTDYRGDIWLDPNQPDVANYIASIAKDLADKGFDEVQLDYVRFFSDGDYSTAQDDPAQHAVLPAAGHPAPVPDRLAARWRRPRRSWEPTSSRSASSPPTTRGSASGRR